jgi:hypothetical protein
MLHLQCMNKNKDSEKVICYIIQKHNTLHLGLNHKAPEYSKMDRTYDAIKNFLQGSNAKYGAWNSFILHCVSVGFPIDFDGQELFFPEKSNIQGTKKGGGKGKQVLEEDDSKVTGPTKDDHLGNISEYGEETIGDDGDDNFKDYDEDYKDGRKSQSKLVKKWKISSRSTKTTLLLIRQHPS